MGKLKFDTGRDWLVGRINKLNEAYLKITMDVCTYIAIASIHKEHVKSSNIVTSINGSVDIRLKYSALTI